MPLNTFLQKITHNEKISFEETIAIITEHYNYQPSAFSNGKNENNLFNSAGSNEGSCKIFYFAKINQLTTQQTLNLFGDFYHLDVLQNPSAINHQNIRHFMQSGWDGISFSQQVLRLKTQYL